ncbi:DUF6122 family protein [Agaribacterium sp. ZY112]|uniref:DUF6122 family protein n=1 Tax=Agaribacterium sp. ZY112 TaxID=3233574 RepID=UPI00352531CE
MWHIALHVLVPLCIAVALYQKRALKAFLFMLLAFAIDIDHLLAQPIYDPTRCSVDFHPLHSLYLLPLYILLSLQWRYKPLQWFAWGLVIHMGLDSLDCMQNQGVWFYQHEAKP